MYKGKILFNCSCHNDLYTILRDIGYKFPRFETLDETLENASSGDGILILSDTYPKPCIEITKEHLVVVKEKGLKLFIEYPKACYGMTLGKPRPTKWERVVVVSDYFEPIVERDSILGLHGCWFLPIEGQLPEGNVHLVASKIAGYDRAVYGITGESHPILFELEGYNIMVSTSNLSNFVTGRYGPMPAWKGIWETLLEWIGEDKYCISWTPTVDVSYGKEDKLPADVESKAIEKSYNWFKSHAVYSIASKKGVIEGYESAIDYDGRQMPVIRARGDCNAEAAMVFAYDWKLRANPHSRYLAEEMLDNLWSSPEFYNDDRESSIYGLSNWSENNLLFYGDDNARVLIATIVAAAILEEDRWDEEILSCILANFRTGGRLGFRRNSLRAEDLEKNGWRHYYDEDFVIYAPHYQGFIWACYLWAYRKTGYGELLKRTMIGLEMMMKAYPNEWIWTNGISQEIARMILPLSYIIQIEKDGRYVQWLDMMIDELWNQMQPSGAIYEKLGPMENGKYPPPQSNDDYGTNEASLIQSNGDPASDLLYTANWAFMGLHEVAMATGDERVVEMADKLARFLCRIQVVSSEHPYLNGAWMRSFDDELWEYWGSSADFGWGAWCVESGWTNTWIASTLAARKLSTSIFELSMEKDLKVDSEEIIKAMLT